MVKTGGKEVLDRIQTMFGLDQEPIPASSMPSAIRWRRDEAAPDEAKLRAQAVPPEDCNPGVGVSPARGPVDPWRDRITVMTGAGPRSRPEPMPGGMAARVVSPLDQLERASRRRGSGPIFTPGQHEAAAVYAELFERVESGMVKCSNLEGGTGGGDGNVMDEIVHNIRRLRRMNVAIGTGPVLQPREASAVAGRWTIRADEVVHWALIRRQPLSELLARHGWAMQTRYLEKLRKGLGEALDRLYAL